MKWYIGLLFPWEKLFPNSCFICKLYTHSLKRKYWDEALDHLHTFVVERHIIIFTLKNKFHSSCCNKSKPQVNNTFSNRITNVLNNLWVWIVIFTILMKITSVLCYVNSSTPTSVPHFLRFSRDLTPTPPASRLPVKKVH